MGTHLASYIRRVLTSAGTNARRRPLAVLLSTTLVLTSLNFVAATEPEDGSAGLKELKSRGPHAAFDINAAGKVVPRPQDSDDLDALVAKAAQSLNEGKARGLWKVADDFTVTLTAKGRRTAREITTSMSPTGCEQVRSIGADWTGFQVEIENTCSEEEYERRIDELLASSGQSAAIPKAAGFVVPITRPDTRNPAVISNDFNCVVSIAATFGTFISAAALLVLPWLGWIFFTITWTGFSTVFLRVVVDTIQNCTQVIEVRVKRQIWVTHEPTLLPLAFARPALSIVDDFVRPDDPNSVWIDSWRTCTRTSSGGYRASGYGYSVPTTAYYTRC